MWLAQSSESWEVVMRAIGMLVSSFMFMALVACGVRSDQPASEPSTTSTAPMTTASNEGGFGAPSRSPGEFDVGPRKPVVGTLRLADGGCWYAEINGVTRLAVFPVGFELNPESGATLVGQEGAVYHDGDDFDGVASMVFEGVVSPRAETLIPGGEDGRWGNYMAFCQPRHNELVVFDSLVPEYHPAALDSDEVVALLEQAKFIEHWNCGRGWAVSTSDQRIGLVVFEATAEAGLAADRLELPDPGWRAEVLIGKNLFSENCNDAIEDWVALPSVTTRWPLIAGTVTVADPVPDPNDDPARVRAVLEDGQIETELGRVSLPSIDLDNRSFNFFAG